MARQIGIAAAAIAGCVVLVVGGIGGAEAQELDRLRREAGIASSAELEARLASPARAVKLAAIVR